MMQYTILKLHANGNDFLLIDEEITPITDDASRIKLAKLLTDRKNGIGSDGLVFYQTSKKYDGRMRMFNPDGSEAEMCGNGLRCLGRYAIEKLQKDTIYIETNKGFEKVTQKKLNNSILYEVLFENISLDNETISRIQLDSFPEIKFSRVSMPNPHIIATTNNFNLLEEVGKSANSDLKHFSNGINVNFIKILGRNLLYIRTYERGAGITLSCGSGNSASSLISCILDICDWNKNISIYNDGGIIKCFVNKLEENRYAVAILGSVTYVFKSQIKIDDKGNILKTNIKTYPDEVNEYEESLKYKNSLIKEYNI
ncbi:MAG TPA: diaminopimelate epimerase [Arcobacter sp.]|nr:diaminopimelate epimerase [Arcobacter sp.]